MQNITSARSIRGATTSQNNTESDISEATIELIEKLISENEVSSENIVNVIFTLTHDLNASFPAKAARIKFKWDDVPMICTQEIPVPDSLKSCIRVMITFNTIKSQKEIRHAYLRGARALRPDLIC